MATPVHHPPRIANFLMSGSVTISTFTSPCAQPMENSSQTPTIVESSYSNNRLAVSIEKPLEMGGFSYLSHKNIFPFYFYLSKIFYIFANQLVTSYFYCSHICNIFATRFYNSLIIKTY